MHLRVIRAIAWKDLKSATRDGRIALGFLMPLALGAFYNFAIPDNPKLTATVTIASPDATRLPEALKTVVGSSAQLTFHTASGLEAVKTEVNSGKADVGLVLPAAFDQSVAQGASPTMIMVRSPSAAQSQTASIVAFVNAALRQMAGQNQPASVVVQLTAPSGGDIASAINLIGARKFLVVGSLIMLIAMIAVYILPVLLTEEYEKRTADALLMIGSQTDLVLAKATVGLTFVAISSVIFLLLTRLSIVNPALFAVAVVGMAICLVGFGLLMGGLFRTVTQLNNWSTVPLLLLLVPVFFTALNLPAIVNTVFEMTPSGQAVRLLLDSLSSKATYSNLPIAIAVMAGWAVLGYGFLIRQLARREA